MLPVHPIEPLAVGVAASMHARYELFGASPARAPTRIIDRGGHAKRAPAARVIGGDPGANAARAPVCTQAPCIQTSILCHVDSQQHGRTGARTEPITEQG